MISLQELNPHGFEMDEEQERNLAILHERINKVREAYAKAMYVTTGFRTWEDHVRIYRDKAKRAGIEFDESKVPKGSQHLKGAAVDIADHDGSLWKWCMINMDKLAAIGLYLEDRGATPTWVHFQTAAPKSGKRVFKP